MTINNAKATTHACPARPTTKSICPEGAGIIDNAPAHETAHTPPQACAAPPSCATAQQPRKSLPAQLAEGYEHLVGELVDALEATLLRLQAYLEAETPMPADSMEVLRDKIDAALELYRTLPGGEA